MKKIRVLALLLSLCLLFASTACQSEQDALYSQALDGASSTIQEELPESEGTDEFAESVNSVQEDSEFYADPYNPSFNYLESRPSPEELFPVEENTELSGTLTISTSIGSEMLENWVAAFEAAYPNVDIQINAGFDSAAAAAQAEREGGGLRAENQQNIVELFAGTAGDIVELTTAPYQRYMESGLFWDLNQFMDSDPDFHREDYYTNVLEAWETEEGELPVVGTVAPELMYFNKEVLDDLGIDLLEDYPEGMNYQEVLSLYREALEKGALEDGAPLGKYMSPTSFDAFENLNYLDRDMTASRFDDPGYVEYLTAMKEVPTGAAPFSIAASYEPFEGREDLVNIGGIQISYLGELSGLTSVLGGVFQTYRLENGGTAFRGMNMFGITAACENPELAWEFLKFMISQKDFPDQLRLYGDKDRNYRELYGSNLPIHRGNLQALCDAYYQDETVFEAADQLMKQFTTLQFQEGELGASLFEIYLNYYLYDLIDAQACAQQLQERAWIYFNE